MNISNFEIGEDLTELGAGGTETSFARFQIIAQNLKYIFSLLSHSVLLFFINECIETSAGSASHSFPVQTGCKGRAGW